MDLITKLAITGFILLSTGAFANPVVIKAKEIIDPSLGKLTASRMLIQDGKIKALGKFKIPKNAVIYDYSDSILTVGLGDAHTHLCTSFDPNKYVDLTDQKNRQRVGSRVIDCIVNAKSMLKSGFTMVRDLGNSGDYLDVDLANAARERKVPVPDFFYSGKIISPYGGQSIMQPSTERLHSGEYIFADTKDELLKAVRQNLFYGSHVIKLASDTHSYRYSEDDIRFVAKIAHDAKKTLAVHAWTADAVYDAVKGGADSIEHGALSSDRELILMAKKGTYFSHASTTIEHASAIFNLPENSQIITNIYKDNLALLKNIKKHKVALVFATDTISSYKGKGRGVMAIDHIDSYVEAGFTDEEIFSIMTIDVAKLLGDISLAQIKVGHRANLIITPQNPQENIQTLKQVQHVFLNGTKVF